jgi:hypothetical protein
MDSAEFVWSLADLRRMASRRSTRPETRARFAVLAAGAESQQAFSGANAERAALLRTYERRARRASLDRDLDGTQELVDALRDYTGDVVEVVAGELQGSRFVVFVSQDHQRMLGCVSP